MKNTPKRRASLIHCDVVEQLIKLRNGARSQALRRIIEEAEPKAVIDLGIDSNCHCAPRLSYRGRHEWNRFKAAESELPSTLLITAPMIGGAHSMPLKVACGNPRSALMVHLSRASIVYLHTAIAHQLHIGGNKRRNAKYVATKRGPYAPRRHAKNPIESEVRDADVGSVLHEVEDE